MVWIEVEEISSIIKIFTKHHLLSTQTEEKFQIGIRFSNNEQQKRLIKIELCVCVFFNFVMVRIFIIIIVIITL